ncbi:MAG: sensor histidine kinase [Hyphomicrobiales bacterium]
MSGGSLRLRLLAAAAISIAVALFLAGLALVQLFEQQVRDRVLYELNNDLLQLAGAIEVATGGGVSVGRRLADPRFEEPYGGRYWRIDFASPGEVAPQEPLRSRSLWDADLDPAKPLQGPGGERLVEVKRQIKVAAKDKELPLWLTVAANEDEVNVPLVRFRNQLILSLSLIGAALTLAAWVQVSVGLSPLVTLRRQLAAIRGGQSQHLSGDFPTELAPLVDELNDVLDMREKSLERARRRAGDLAHGLNTPLTVLSAIARDIRKRKLVKQSEEIEEQADAMRGHVERALAQARLSTGRRHVATPLRPAIEKVVAALVRLPNGNELDWDLQIPADATVPLEGGDLTELLGNLLDNARKWAENRVKIHYETPLLSIEDDGPGVPQTELGRIGERGRRFDESKQGSGLGLSIVEDIADLYGLAVTYGRSGLGGLRVAIRV